MSWSDIFFPGNPGRRDQVVRLSQSILDDMKDNFAATNDLIDLLNTNCGSSITQLTISFSATVQDNANALIAKMTEVQAEVTKIDDKLAAKLDPEIYKKLHLPDLSFQQRLAVAKQAVSVTIGVLASIAGVILITAIRTGAILVSMVVKIGAIATSAVASLALGVLAMGIDMIASAIIGAVERSKLEDAINSLQSAFDSFDPATRTYTKTIYKVEAQIDVLTGK